MITIEKFQLKSSPDRASWTLSEGNLSFQFRLKKIGDGWCVVSFIGGRNGKDKYSVKWFNHDNKANWRIESKGKRNSAKSKEEMLSFITRCEEYLWDEFKIIFMN